MTNKEEDEQTKLQSDKQIYIQKKVQTGKRYDCLHYGTQLIFTIRFTKTTFNAKKVLVKEIVIRRTYFLYFRREISVKTYILEVYAKM